MSENPKEKRNYRKEYDTYHGKPEQIAKRAQRNAAHAVVEKRAGKAISGDVHHKTPLRSGGKNDGGNLEVVAGPKNKGWRKGKTGYD